MTLTIERDTLSVYRAAHQAAVTQILAYQYPGLFDSVDKLYERGYSIYQGALPHLPDAAKKDLGGGSGSREESVATYNRMVSDGTITTKKSETK